MKKQRKQVGSIRAGFNSSVGLCCVNHVDDFAMPKVKFYLYFPFKLRTCNSVRGFVCPSVHLLVGQSVRGFLNSDWIETWYHGRTWHEGSVYQILSWSFDSFWSHARDHVRLLVCLLVVSVHVGLEQNLVSMVEHDKGFVYQILTL